MSETVDSAYISKAVDEIVALTGIKKDFPEGIIYSEFRDSNLVRCIEAVAGYLNLPVKINVSYVSAGDVSGKASGGFTSRDLVEANRAGGGTEGIVAQVSIPANLPLYGSAGLQGFPINVKVSHNCFKYPETFICVLAHEFSHIVLHSLWHREKHNEIYTDLTAMVLGFSDVMRKGRKNFHVKEKPGFIETSTMTYGYLSDNLFDFAYEKLKGILKTCTERENSLKSSVLLSRACLEECKKELSGLTGLLQDMDKKQRKHMKQEDALRIIKMHQPGYFDGMHSAISRTEKRLGEIIVPGGDIQKYTSGTLAEIQAVQERIWTVSAELNDTLKQIQGDLAVLTRNKSFSQKLNDKFRK
jgi:hypothetical protein